MKTAPKEKLDSLVSLGDFYQFFSEIPEEEWLVGLFTKREAEPGSRTLSEIVACCSMGHLGYRGFPEKTLPGAPEAMMRLNALVVARWFKGGFEGSIVNVNDGQDPSFPQTTPKQRILALCSPESK